MHEDPRETQTPSEKAPTAPRRPRRRAVLGLLGSAGVAAAGLAFLATGVTSAPNLPDMISEAPGPPGTQIYRDGRLLIRFDGFVTNSPQASEELEIWADDPQPNAQGVMQRVEQRVNGVALQLPAGRNRPVVRYEVADGHNHFHLKNAAEYTLWTADQTRQVALAQKTEAGFCLEDSERLSGASGSAVYNSSTNDFCRTVPLRMGISPGFRDIYYAGLSYQWVDVSNAAPGRYRLASRADPTDVIWESNEGNNGYAFRDAVVPGYLPRATSVPRVEAGQSAGITLSADRFVSTCFDGDFSPSPDDDPYCAPGPVRYRITSAPARGVLRQGAATLGVGSVVSDGAITYTANPGQRGADSFTYEAYDRDQQTFPRERPQAAVAIQIGAPVTSVAISGAQPSIVAGLSMQLSAVLTNAPSGVTWTTTGGSVTQNGLFTAPGTAGSVVVRATSKDDPSAFAEVTIRVDAAKIQAPAPIYKPPSAIKRFRVGHVGKRIVVAKITAGPRKGTVRATATLGRKVLARCVRPVKANRTVVCKLTLKRSYNLRKVRVTAKFTAAGKTTVRRAFAVTPKRR